MLLLAKTVGGVAVLALYYFGIIKTLRWLYRVLPPSERKNWWFKERGNPTDPRTHRLPLVPPADWQEPPATRDGHEHSTYEVRLLPSQGRPEAPRDAG